MEPAKLVKESCVDADRQNKIIAAEYRASAKLLRRRIAELETEVSAANAESSVKAALDERLKTLNSMYRTTTEIGREAEHYYEKGWWRSGLYTLNPRKRG